jgi:hypothetical protein
MQSVISVFKTMQSWIKVGNHHSAAVASKTVFQETSQLASPIRNEDMVLVLLTLPCLLTLPSPELPSTPSDPYDILSLLTESLNATAKYQKRLVDLSSFQ